MSRTQEMGEALIRRDVKGTALTVLTDNTWDNTQPVVEALVAESKNHPAWRPVRAAALRAWSEAYGDQSAGAWMTAEQFRDWLDVQTWAARRRKATEKPIEAIGMAAGRKLKILRGESPATKLEALACAHYAMGMAPPVPAGDVAKFDAWVSSNFGATDRLAQWLGITPTMITDRMRGFDIQNSRRAPRAPEIGLIRALDWVLRVGPYCPYGQRLRLPVWPGQAMGET